MWIRVNRCIHRITLWSSLSKYPIWLHIPMSLSPQQKFKLTVIIPLHWRSISPALAESNLKPLITPSSPNSSRSRPSLLQFQGCTHSVAPLRALQSQSPMCRGTSTSTYRSRRRLRRRRLCSHMWSSFTLLTWIDYVCNCVNLLALFNELHLIIKCILW